MRDLTDAPKLEWHRFAGLRASGVGLTDHFIVEQDESGFHAMTVHAMGATYPTLEEAKRRCETSHHIRWSVTREEAQKAAAKKQRED